MSDLRSDRDINSLVAFSRARIAEDRAEAEAPGTYSLVAREIETRCDALDELVDEMHASANDGAPPVDFVGIEALRLVAHIWRILPDGTPHPDFDGRWAT